jgi:hypothetical protein
MTDSAVTGRSPAPARPGSRQHAPAGLAQPASLWQRTTWRYWLSLVVLIASAFGLQAAATWFGLHFRKQALELKNPLSALDPDLIDPPGEHRRYVVNEDLMAKMDKLPKEMIESLGTEDFKRLVLTDQQAENDNARIVHLFITYYTGKPQENMVPHVAEECWVAGGYRWTGHDEEVRVPVAGVGAPDDMVPVRVLEFERERGSLLGEGSDVATVAYFFHVNGGYATTRNGVRRSMSNLFHRYGYYAKVEITFTDETGRFRADREATVAGLEPLLERLLPVLLTQHIDLQRFNSNGEADGQPRDAER